jgi:hypothetical protein
MTVFRLVRGSYVERELPKLQNSVNDRCIDVHNQGAIERKFEPVTP